MTKYGRTESTGVRDKRRKTRKGSGFFYRKFKVREQSRTFESGRHYSSFKTKKAAQNAGKGWQKNGHFVRVTKERQGARYERAKKDQYRLWVMIDTTKSPRRKRKPKK